MAAGGASSQAIPLIFFFDSLGRDPRLTSRHDGDFAIFVDLNPIDFHACGVHCVGGAD
jgi:hypothetical protein